LNLLKYSLLLPLPDISNTVDYIISPFIFAFGETGDPNGVIKFFIDLTPTLEAANFLSPLYKYYG